MTQLPYLNLGCGKVILPGEAPNDHWLIDQAIYQYPLWHNVDKIANGGVDECVDIFTYPWPWADNSFDGALLAHIVEHIPHEVTLKAPFDRVSKLTGVGNSLLYSYEEGQKAAILEHIQDGWYAFFSELTRVLTPGAVAHILHPYAWSQGAMTDPTHTRYITEHTWTHSLAKSDGNDRFAYATGQCDLAMVEPAKMWIMQWYYHLLIDPTAPYAQDGLYNWTERIIEALQSRINVVYALYVKLQVMK